MPTYTDCSAVTDYLMDAGSRIYASLGGTESPGTEIGVSEEQYADACKTQLQDEARDVWNQGVDGVWYVDEYHGEGLQVDGMFDVVGSDAPVGREGYRGFALAANALADDLTFTLTAGPVWKGTTNLPAGVEEESTYYGRTASEWTMEVSFSKVPVEATFAGHGEHWWHPVEQPGAAPQSAYADVEWELVSATLRDG